MNRFILGLTGSEDKMSQVCIIIFLELLVSIHIIGILYFCVIESEILIKCFNSTGFLSLHFYCPIKMCEMTELSAENGFFPIYFGVCVD